jgi:hypothetical protein
MTTHCPICGSEVGELPRTGDADGYDCVTHGQFKTSGTVTSTKQKATRAEWEAALASAKARHGTIVPTITTHDFKN